MREEYSTNARYRYEQKKKKEKRKAAIEGNLTVLAFLLMPAASILFFLLISECFGFTIIDELENKFNRRGKKKWYIRLIPFLTKLINVIYFAVSAGVVYFATWLLQYLINGGFSLLDIQKGIGMVWAYIVLQVMTFVTVIIMIVISEKREKKGSEMRFQSKAMKYEEDCNWIDSYLD